MTGFNYNATAATATRLLQRFGKAATLKRIVTGAYDPSTGTAPVTTTSLNTHAAVFAYDQKYIDGTLIKQGDQWCLLSPIHAPKQGDVLNAKSPLTGQYADFTIVAFKAHGPAGTAVLFEAQVRG